MVWKKAKKFSFRTRIGPISETRSWSADGFSVQFTWNVRFVIRCATPTNCRSGMPAPALSSPVPIT
jgi:hypothetical protein